MQAIEFTSQLQNGVIPVPAPYQDWTKKSVRVILLTIEPPSQEKVVLQKTTDSLRSSTHPTLARLSSHFRLFVPIFA